MRLRSFDTDAGNPLAKCQLGSDSSVLVPTQIPKWNEVSRRPLYIWHSYSFGVFILTCQDNVSDRSTDIKRYSSQEFGNIPNTRFRECLKIVLTINIQLCHIRQLKKASDLDGSIRLERSFSLLSIFRIIGWRNGERMISAFL